MPATDFCTVPEHSVILLLGANSYEGVIQFGAFWDLDAALRSQDGCFRQRGLKAFPAREDWSTIWDGALLQQFNPGGLVHQASASHLFLWNWEEGSFKAARAPMTMKPYK